MGLTESHPGGAPWPHPQEHGREFFRCLPHTHILSTPTEPAADAHRVHATSQALCGLNQKLKRWARQTNSWPLGAHRLLEEAGVEGKMTQEAQVTKTGRSSRKGEAGVARTVK